MRVDPARLRLVYAHRATQVVQQWQQMGYTLPGRQLQGVVEKHH
jgi:hypothetical protein